MDPCGLGMPLNADKKALTGIFDSLDDAVARCSCGHETGRNGLDCLMVIAINPKGFFF